MNSHRPDFYLGTDIDGVQLNAEQLNVRSKDLNSLIGSVTYTEALFHILQGRLPTSQERQLFDIVLVSFHGGFGLLPPTTFVPRIVAGTGVSTAQALAAGFLASGPYHVGAVEQAMRHFEAVAIEFGKLGRKDATAAELEQFAYDNTAAQLLAGVTIPGFGHPLLRKDPRPTHVRRLICELKAEHVFFDIYDGVVRCIEEKKGVFPNVDGITAAILLRLGFNYQYGTALFLLARSAGMLAHIVEEQSDMPYQTMRRFMLLPMISPKLFNANIKTIAKKFNKLRDSTIFKSLKGFFGRRQTQQLSEKERADRAVVAQSRPQRAGVSIASELTTASAMPTIKEDHFVAASQAMPTDAGADDSLIPEDLLDDCTSPELLAGATYFLTNCLQSLNRNAATVDGSGQSQKTQQLIESALKLVREASEQAE